jgi:UDP-2,3-diacylglucosamine hydrolase
MGKTFFFSDVHLGTNDKAAEKIKEQKLLSFLEYVEKAGERLYIMGDLFDFWFEYRTVIPRGYMRVLSALARLQEKGIELHYVAGNHDFWVRDFLTVEMGIQMHFDPIEQEIEGSRFFLHHGDGVAKFDKGYRLMKRVFRYPPNIFLYSLLHPDIGIPLAKWVANLSRNHQKHREIDDSDYRELAAQKFAEGCKYVIFGHLHHPIRDEFSGGVYLNLGDWMRHFTYAVFDGKSLQLCHWED